MKGLIVSIYKSDYGDTSNGGISHYAKKATLVGPGIPQVFDVSPDAPAVVIKKIMDHMCVEPLEAVPHSHIGYMHGGCFVYTSDSRFPSEYPLALHDRSESQAV